MPDVVGLDYKEATEKVEALGLKVDITERVESKEFEVDQVVSQSQDPGTKLKEGFTVALVISTGVEKVTVPNLVQKDLKEAQYLLENEGLKLGAVEYVQNDLPEGAVISQSPFAGLDIGVGGTVDLFVSKGKDPEKTIMPKLVGISLEEAKTKLAEYKIGINTISYNFSDDFAKDIIMIQSVEAGKDILTGESVNLVVSKGKSTTVTTPPAGNNGNGNGNTKPTVKIYTETMDLVDPNSEEILVRILMNQDGVETVAYEKMHNKSEGKFTFVIEGEGKATINIFFNETLMATKLVEFK